MTQGLQFSLLFSGLDGLTTGDTAGLKSEMADSAATQQAVAFRQILQDEQYSKTVRQGQTFAATPAQQQAYGQSTNATEHKAAQLNLPQGARTVVGQESIPLLTEDSDLADSSLAERWLGLIRQSSDASAQLKHKNEFFKIQPGLESQRIGPVPDEEAELYLDLPDPESAATLIDDACHGLCLKHVYADPESAATLIVDAELQEVMHDKHGKMPSQQKEADDLTLKYSAQVKPSADMSAVIPDALLSKRDAGGESLGHSLDTNTAETDELEQKQNSKQSSRVADATEQNIPVVKVTTLASSTLASSSQTSQSENIQSSSNHTERLTIPSNQNQLSQNTPFKAELNVAAASQHNMREDNQDGEPLYQAKPGLEQTITIKKEVEAATTAAKSDTAPLLVANAAQSATSTQVHASQAQPTTMVIEPTASAVDVEAVVASTTAQPLTDEISTFTSESKASSAAVAVAATASKDSNQNSQSTVTPLNQQAEQVSRAEPDVTAKSTQAEPNINVSVVNSSKVKSSAGNADIAEVSAGKVSVTKTAKGFDSADSQSEQQGQSRQDGRQFTFNRLEVALAQNNTQPTATVAANTNAQVADSAGAIARAESFATVLEQQNRPQSTPAAPSLAAQLKQLNLQRQDAAGQLRERVQLMVRQNVQVAEIRLDPAELGQMQIRVNLQQEQASVQFIVQQQHAKELLEQQMPRLRELLQQQGIQLGEGQVQQQTREERQQAEQRSAGGAQHNDDKQAGTDSTNQTTTVELSQSERLVDYYA